MRQDIDIFTDNPAGVRQASQLVTAALVAAGYAVESVSEMAELDETFGDFGDDLAELEIRDGQQRQSPNPITDADQLAN